MGGWLLAFYYCMYRFDPSTLWSSYVCDRVLFFASVHRLLLALARVFCGGLISREREEGGMAGGRGYTVSQHFNLTCHLCLFRIVPSVN